MNALEEILESIFKGVENGTKFLFEQADSLLSGKPKKNREYIADFASPGSLLSSSHKGFCLNGRKNLSVKNSYQNALAIGGTGTGKSTIVLITSLFTMLSSFIVHDPSGELFMKTSGYLKSIGYRVLVLDFSNLLRSSYYNLLSRIKSNSDIQKIANMLVEGALGKKSKDPFWNIQATALLTIIISLLQKMEPVYRTMHNVRQILNHMGSQPKSVDALFVKYADDSLFNEYKSFIAYDDKVVNGVIATCKASLQIFSDESIASITSYDDFSFQTFRDEPTVLFINNSVADQRYYSVLTSIFFEQFFSFLLSRFPKDHEKDVFLLIDEASSLYLPTLSLAVANVRKHRSGIMLLLQDFNQLIHQYGKQEAEAIKANCFAKIYFTGTSLDTAKELEQIMGRYEYENSKGSKIVRPLMTSDEIRIMKSTQALLICGNNQPIMTRLKPFYQQTTFREYSEIPVAELSEKYLGSTIPTIEFEPEEIEIDA
jgi:type IV secretion system protein VirD4